MRSHEWVSTPNRAMFKYPNRKGEELGDPEWDFQGCVARATRCKYQVAVIKNYIDMHTLIPSVKCKTAGQKAKHP